MRKNIFMLLVISLIALAFSACAVSDRNTTTDKTAGTQPKMTNSDLENKIKAKLNADTELARAKLDVDANADRNEATLSGTVESQALRMRAVDLAKSAQPSLVITDKIEVKPREISRADYTEEHARAERERAKDRGDTIGSSLEDAWIHTKITAKLIGNSETPQRKINVDVNNNIVTLRGTVDNAAEKAEAERVAKETDGVKRVVNQLKVKAS